MADQSIEIRLILRDEMTKALAPIEAAVKRIGETRVDRFHGALDRLAPAVRVVHRELSTLSRMTLGGLVGGGVIAGLAALTKSLQDMAAQNIQLRYTAQSLGVSTKFLEDYKSALVGLGESPEAAASSLKRSLETLDEFMVKGSKSSLGSFLKESIGGPQIAGQLRDIIAKQGEEAGLKFLINVANRIKDRKGRAEFLRQANLPYAALGIDKMLSQLPERIQLSNEQVDAMAIANMQLERHSENIKTILAGAMLPAITAITKSLSEYLQTEAGQKFTKQLGEIAGDISKAISTWIAEGGLESALKALEMAFGAADKVIKGIGLSWPQAIGVLVGIKFAAWLIDVAAGLAGISKLSWVLRLLPFVAMYYGAKWFRDLVDTEGRQKEALEKHPGKLSDQPGLTEEQKKNLDELQKAWPMIVPKPEKQSGLGKPETEDEQRAAAATDASERKALNDKLAELAIGTGHLADYIGQTAIGGPEGTPGDSGYRFGGGGASGRYDPVTGMPIKGPPADPSKGRSLPLLPPGATTLTLLPGTPRPAQTEGRGFASWYGNRPDLGFTDREDRGRQGVREQDQGIALGDTKTLGKWFYLTDPNTGIKHLTQQTDTGPNFRTQNLVDIHASQLARMGYTAQTFPSGKGLWDLVRAPEGVEKPGFRGGGAAAAEANLPGDSLISALANEGSGRAVNGSATIDIDVGGLGQPARDPSTLFRPQPLDGAVQMQNATQPEHNPLSFQ